MRKATAQDAPSHSALPDTNRTVMDQRVKRAPTHTRLMELCAPPAMLVTRLNTTPQFLAVLFWSVEKAIHPARMDLCAMAAV